MLGLLILTSFLQLLICLAGEDYYQLLGVSKDADDRTIRKAFKKLAITKHPDRDPDNPDAHNNFIKINKAYEVLKDPDLRQKYDRHGEEGLDDSKAGQRYESWDFYTNKFGIYDDDPEIATLSRQDFQHYVIDSGDVWFVNFYSTFCSHCHELAPTWREFARKMNGIIKIGAVNCAEDPHLCQSQHVRAYPSLVAYPDHSFFQGRRDIDSFVEFITSKLRVELIQVTSRNVESLSMQWEPYSTRPWLIDFCDEMENCFKEANRRLIAHMLQGIVNIGTVMCHVENKDKLCEELLSEGLAYYPAGNISKKHQKEIDTLDLIAVHQNVLRLLPDIPVLDEDNYRNLLDRLDEPKKEDLLVLFTAQKSDAKDELKKLSAFSTNFRLAECTKLADGCEGMRLGPLPKLVYFRPEGHYLIYYGKTIELGDVRSFVVSAKKSTMISMTENYFDEIKQKQEESASNDIWLVDMFAPWCHPCMLALNELNALPIELNGRRLRVGIIDCDIHKQVCQNNGVSSYPTTLLLFHKSDQRLIGFHYVDHIIDFVYETLNPSVIELDNAEFDRLVVNKPADKIFVVDFYAPWCGPCQQLMPEYRKLARIVQEETDLITFGSVDCDAHRNLCQANSVNQYPTIRVYTNNAQYDYPSNWWRNVESMKQWVTGYLPTNVHSLDEYELIDLIEGDYTKAVILDFYASWCQPCQIFAPIFDQASRLMDNRIVFAKIDCAQYPDGCAGAAISAYPTIKVYSPGRRSLNGGIRIHPQNSAQQLVEIANRILGKIRDEL